MDDTVIAARPGLSRPVRLDELAAAVAAERSWRGVLRRLGFTTSRTGRVLRQACDELGIDYTHFRQITPDDQALRTVIPNACTWSEALERLGYAPGSGSARATVRKHCRRLGLDTAQLTLHSEVPPGVDQVHPHGATDLPRQLRSAGPFLVAAALTLQGYGVSLAAEGLAYDLVVDMAGTLRRVQVKTSSSMSRGQWCCGLRRTRYSASGHGGHRHALYTSEDIDFFACVDGRGRIYLIPIGVVEGRSTITLRRYEAFRVPFLESG
jgi:hypothetical protein